MELLDAAYAAGKEAYPSVSVSRVDFDALIVARCDRELSDFLAAIDPAELFLVCGCLGGDRLALAAFEASYLSEVKTGAKRLGCDQAELDDIRQEVARQLLVGGREAKLGVVCGRGDLRALIRLMALRTGISLRRKHGRETLVREEPIELAFEGDLATVVLEKKEHRDQLSSALEASMVELDPVRRSVLKLHCLDGVGLAELATMHRVDRSTISRWIAKARSDILSATRRRLVAAGIPAAQFESFVDVLRSNFDLSIKRMLGEDHRN